MATDDMRLGVNSHVNLGTRKASLKLMGGGPSKVKKPNSHPSNPIHKQATEAQGTAVNKKPTQTPATDTQTSQPTTTTTDSIDTHHVNKALVAVGALALVGFVIWAGR